MVRSCWGDFVLHTHTMNSLSDLSDPTVVAQTSVQCMWSHGGREQSDMFCSATAVVDSFFPSHTGTCTCPLLAETAVLHTVVLEVIFHD